MRGIDQVYYIHSPAHGELTVYDTLTSLAFYNHAFNFGTFELMTSSHESSLQKPLEIDLALCGRFVNASTLPVRS